VVTDKVTSTVMRTSQRHRALVDGASEAHSCFSASDPLQSEILDGCYWWNIFVFQNHLNSARLSMTQRDQTRRRAVFEAILALRQKA
jgi:hypothetical protein